MFDDMLIPENDPLPTPVYRPGPGSPPPQGGFQPQMNYMQHPQHPQYPQQQQNFRTSAGSLSRPSSRASAGPGNRSSAMSSQASTKSGFFGGWKKKNIKNDFMEDDDDEKDDTFDPTSSYQGDQMSIKQLTGLRDRDRYPTMAGGNDSNSDRTMSMSSSFDTSPIIPTIGEGGTKSNKEYRKNLANSRAQLLRSDGGYPGPGGPGGPGGMMNQGYGPQGNNHMMRSPTGSPPFGPGPNGRPLSPQEMMRLRSMSNSTGPPSSFDHNYPRQIGPGALAAQGRSMSMGGFSRGPPPNMMGVMQGPPGGPGQNGMRPLGRKSLPIGTAGPPNAGLPLNGTIHEGVPRLPLNGTEAPVLSRSSSKSSSPSPASNSMSRPNSQALSSSSSSPENNMAGPGKGEAPVKMEPFSGKGLKTPTQRPQIETKSIGVMTELKETMDRASSPVPNSPRMSREVIPGVGKSLSPIAMRQKERIDSVERASSPVPMPLISQVIHPTSASVPNAAPSAASLQLMNDLKERNISLLDEVRLVTSELADSIRRELGLSENSPLEAKGSRDVEDLAMNHRERATFVSSLQIQLDIERRKRLIAEDRLLTSTGNEHMSRDLKPLYDAAALDSRLADSERKLSNKEFENETLNTELEEVKEQFKTLEEEASTLRLGLTAEKSSAQDLELLKAAGNPIELLQSIDELKVENKKLTNIIEENSSRGPLGEKIKAIEEQRDALREALRSLRERKDHEIRQLSERVRHLDSKLDKERVVNNQIQRKYVQGLRSASSLSPSPTIAVSGNAGGVLPSPNMEAFNLQLPKRRMGSSSQLGIPILGSGDLGSPARSTHNASPGPGSRSASPVPSFEISNEPSWIEHHREQMPTPIGGGRFGGHNAGNSIGSMYSLGSVPGGFHMSSSSLSLPNGRTEQIPLSLGNSS